MAESVMAMADRPPLSPAAANSHHDGDALPSVVIFDRSAFNRSCLAASLSSQHLRHVHAYDHVHEVPAHIDCHLALLFRNLGSGDTDELASELQAAMARWPGVRTIALLGNASPDMLAAIGGLDCAPSAIVSDDIAADLLVAVLRLAHHGYSILPETVFQALGDRVERPGARLDHGWDAISADRPLLATSTARQREVMHLLLMGLSNKHIAQRLVISESTVKVHIRAIMNLLHVQNRTQIVARLMGASSEGHG